MTNFYGDKTMTVSYSERNMMAHLLRGYISERSAVAKAIPTTDDMLAEFLGEPTDHSRDAEAVAKIEAQIAEAAALLEKLESIWDLRAYAE